MNRAPFGVDEWYHCYTRGVDKRRTFESKADYLRFQQILYLANSTDTIHRSDLGPSHDAVFAKERGKPLAAVAAYCIMPNHFHLVLQEVREDGISKYMQKIGTAYAMYFNIKNRRVGNLFVRPFRSRHISDDGYWMHISQYLHLNPIELYEPGWKRGEARYSRALEQKLIGYNYSSLQDQLGMKRAEGAILQSEARELMAENTPSLRESMSEAAEYYRALTI